MFEFAACWHDSLANLPTSLSAIRSVFGLARMRLQILPTTRLFLLLVLRCALRLRCTPDFLRSVLSLLPCGEESAPTRDGDCSCKSTKD